MSLGFLLQVLASWQVLLVAGLLMLLIPLISYLASFRPGRRRRRFMAPADRALASPPGGPVEPLGR